MSITKDKFFKAGRATAQDKAASTNDAAREIIAAEALQRARKTERLRQLRETQQAEAPSPSPGVGKKPARART